MFKKILVPLDGSAGSKRALTAAIDLAQKYVARLCVLSVEEHLPVYALVADPIRQPTLAVRLLPIGANGKAHNQGCCYDGKPFPAPKVSGLPVHPGRLPVRKRGLRPRGLQSTIHMRTLPAQTERLW